VGAAAGAVEVF